jgi:tetratricopeptide (TPR) repeat protein
VNDEEAMQLVYTEEPAAVAQGLEVLRERAEGNPDDAERWFVYGGALDFSDRPEEAIVAYGRVFDIGVEALPANDQPRIYVQAGSTLRNLGRIREARTLLTEGMRRFPSFRAIPAFLALVEVSDGEERAAVDLLFDALLLEESGDDSIATYRRALTWYAGNLRQGDSAAPEGASS